MKRRLASSAILVLLMLGVSALAQVDVYGNFAGTVKDPTGAVVPNAKITITNLDQSVVVRSLTTDGGGNYSAQNLPVAKYRITAEAPGFKNATINNVQLNVNDRLTENFQLSVGQSSQTVSVEADAVQVELQTTAAAGLITGTQVRELALNNRNYEQLVALQPGVSYGGTDQLYIGLSTPAGQSTAVSFSINGQRNSGNNWTIDGADNVDRGSNLTLLNFPSVDAIAEFKTLRGQYNAEFGRSASGVINVITKSGTKQFHGDAFEFFRNDVLNANTVLNKLASPAKPRDPLRYNNFGYTIGGPVFIPHVYNRERSKTFFFFSQEYRRIITYSSVTGTVPTAAERLGNFAAPICTSVTVTAGTPKCGTVGTSITNIDPVAQAYLKDVFSKLPLPNNPNSSDPHSFITPLRNLFDNRQDLVRIDQNLGTRFNGFFRYIHDTIPTQEPQGIFGGGTRLPSFGTSSTQAPGTSYLGHVTFSMTPTLLIDGGYAYSYGAIISLLTGLASNTASPDIHVTLPFASTLARVPSLTFNGASGAAALSAQGPYYDYNRDHNVFGNVTKVIGAHSIKAGASYHHYQKTENNGSGNEGAYTFGAVAPPAGGASAYMEAYAEFLQGFVQSFNQPSLDITPDVRTNQLEFYAQDEWRLRPNFTLNYGARYSYFQQPIDARKMLTNFDPQTYDPAKAPTIDSAGRICTAAPCAGGGVPNPNYDPLNGIIINGRNSPFGDRVGSTDTANIAPRVGFAWDPLGTGKTSIRAGYGVAYDSTLFGVYEQNIFVNPPFVQNITIPNTQLANPGAGTPSVSANPKALHGTPANYKTPNTQQWSLDVQQEMARNLLVDIGYYGSKGTHLLVIEDLNEPQPGQYVTSGIFTPTASTPFISAGSLLINRIRPFRGYGQINSLQTGADSNYHSLQTALRWQFSGDSLIGAAYTWSKCLTDSRSDRSNTPLNTYNLAAEYGPCQLDRRNVFTANYVYAIPFFRNGNGLLKYTLGGWEASGIVSVSSGLPLNPAISNTVDPAGQGQSRRPDMVADPNTNAPHTIKQWFNTAAFTAVPAGQFRPGTSRPGAILGPGFQRFDFSLFKNIPIHESVSMQFRAEAFNVFNHTNFDSVNTTLGAGTYGQVTGFRDPRIMQLALKFYF